MTLAPMSADSIWLRSAFVLVVAYDVWVLWRVAVASKLALKAKLALGFLVVALPVLGAAGVHAFVAALDAAPRRADLKFAEQSPNDQGPAE